MSERETPRAPDEPVGRFETANDPTGGGRWSRRRFRLPSGEATTESLDAVLQVPGVARAALDPGAGELVADIEVAVVSDDELAAAIGRGGVDVEGWADEPIPASERPAAEGPPDPTESPDAPAGDGEGVVDEASEESFPASDPPASWARSPEDGGT